MTVDEIYDEVKKGLDAWMPRIPEDVDAQMSAWKDYIPDFETFVSEDFIFWDPVRLEKEKEALERAKMYFGEYN